MNPLYEYPLELLDKIELNNGWGRVNVALAIKKIYQPAYELVIDRFDTNSNALYIPYRERTDENYAELISGEQGSELPYLFYAIKSTDNFLFIIPNLNTYLPIICTFNNNTRNITGINCSNGYPFLEDIENSCNFEDGQCSNAGRLCRGTCEKRTYEHVIAGPTFSCECI